MSDNKPIPAGVNIEGNKYTIQIDNGSTRILRDGEPWLENPEGAKAWIAVAGEIETLRAAAQAQSIKNDLLLRIVENLANSFSNDKEVNGGDLVEDLGRLYDTVVVPQMKAAGLPAMVIYSESEEGYWSNDDGWTGLDGAEHFFDVNQNLPMSSGNDARFITAEDAERQESQMTDNGPSSRG